MRTNPTEDAIIRVERLTKKLAKNKEFREFAVNKFINTSGFDELESYVYKYLPKEK